MLQFRPALSRLILRGASVAPFLVPIAVTAQARPAARPVARQLAPTQPMIVDSAYLAGLKWREVGPNRGGRSVAVAGSDKRPNEYWMGTTGGGVFKTTDGGENWAASSDGYFGGTIGAIAVDQQNPDIVWVGGGETDIRGNTAGGDGLWKSMDAGKTWTFLKWKYEHISTIRIHPTNSDVAYIGVFGDAFKVGDRGLYKTTDGGKSFNRILHVNDSTGVIDIAMDPSNPDVMYVAMWQAYRTPWSMSSGGVHSGLFKTTDAGTTWTRLTGTAQGLPSGVIGKIGVAVSPAKPSRVWAMIEHDSGGVYRSDDAGATWSYINRDRNLRQRAWYYTQIVADPKDTNVVYGLNVSFYRSRDGGKTFAQSIRVPHGDNHDLWISPSNPNRMVEGNDGGATVTTNGGRTWTDIDFPTAQWYHVDVSNEYPYKICGAQQDNSTLCGPSRKPGRVEVTDWEDSGGGESGYVTPHPTKPWIVFAGSYGGLLTRKDMRTGFERNVTVYPNNPMGESSKDIKIRFQWTFPIVFSRHNPNVLYAAGSRLFRSTNEGESWTPVGPEFARADTSTMGASGGPITKDQTGVETYALVFAFDESPVRAGVLWVGSDDGLIWISQNNGVTWRNVTPPNLGDFTRVSIIEPSNFDAGTAYVAANRYQQGDKRPILFKTTDYGRTWTSIVSGIADDHFLRVVREDPKRRGLLYAGTERGVYVSFDDGMNWQSLRRNLPLVPVHDIRVKDNDVILATHGRGFWVMDNVTVLHQLNPQVASKPAHLFRPTDTYRTDFGGGFFAQLAGGGGGGVGANPPGGVQVHYFVKDPRQRITMEFLDARGQRIQSFTSEQDPETAADSIRLDSLKTAAIDSMTRGGLSSDSAKKVATARFSNPGAAGADFAALFSRAPRPPRVPNTAGLNTFSWNMRYPDAERFEGIIMWAAGTTGPKAPPGTYSVRMSVAGETQSQTFRLMKDPRSDATDADLLEQFRTLIAIRDKTTEANLAVRLARNLRWNVGDRTEKLNGQQQAEFRNIADKMMNAVTVHENEVYQTKNQSGQDPLNYPIKLNNKIAALAGTVGEGEYRPTVQAKTVFRDLGVQLDVQTKAMNKVIDDNLPALNAILRAAGLPELRKSTDEIKPQKPAVAM